MIGTRFYLRICNGLIVALPAFVVQAVSAQQNGEVITYAKHVAPILQEKCQVCHQPNSVAPMSLLTYEDARPYAELMKYKVENRIMPPWHIDRTVGIQRFQTRRKKNSPWLA